MNKLSILVLALLVAGNAEAQEPRPLLEGPNLGGARQVRKGIIERAQNAREDIQESYEDRRSDVKDGSEERRDNFRENVGDARSERVENINERRENIEERRVMIAENMTERREQVKNRIEERKTELQTRREKMRENNEVRRTLLKEDRQERVIGLFEKMFTGFSSAADKLSEVHERLSVKISKLSDEGVDVKEAESQLETAGSLLDDTLLEIDAVKAELNEAIEGEITKEYVSELVSGAKESIRSTHDAYKSVISEINQ